jgi:hypothetical protein
MKNMVFVKAAVFLLLFVGLTAGVSAQITISGGFALSQLDTSSDDLQGLDGGVGYGGNVYLDYLLPISVPLSLGVEIGYDSAKMMDKYDDTFSAIPILARVAYHFDIAPKLDLYVVGKIGIAFGSWQGEQKDSVEEFADIETPLGLAFGFDLGAAFYFTSNIGAFVEAGFDRYNLSLKETSKDDSSQKLTADVPFNRFLTLGISAKL